MKNIKWKVGRNILLIIFVFMQHAYAQNLNTVSLTPKKISDGLYLIDNFGCNIAVSVGGDGLLIIDSGISSKADQVKSAIKEVSADSIKFILNTHFHFDHVGGNKKLVNKKSVIIAHNNVSKRMKVEWNPPEILGSKWPKISPYSKSALPEICFSDSLTIYFNDDTIKCFHFPQAHSDGDAIFCFKKANVIHTGDLFLSNGFPVIDIFAGGGTINGHLDAVSKIISLCDEKTIVIPGHGPLSDRNQLIEYLNMLAASKERIANLIKQGKTLEEIVAAKSISDLYKRGESWLNPKLFIYTIYNELIKH
jgi:glyoxylase-like metal-dependent hydrolase (beta-lactamase superfamily II)